MCLPCLANHANMCVPMRRKMSANNLFRFSSFFVLFFLVISLTGCARLRHLSRLLRIKRYSDNKDAQRAFVAKQDENFEKILKAVKDKSITQYKTRKEFLDVFGEPVLSRIQMKDGQETDVWLYRRGAEFFPEEKVYLYFSPDGHLRHWEYIVAPNGKVRIVDTKYKGGPG